MSLPTDLLQNLGYLPTGGEAVCQKPKKSRNRPSKFSPYRHDILAMRANEKSLAQILRLLNHRYPDVKLPSSRSQLLRFIQKCRGSQR